MILSDTDILKSVESKHLVITPFIKENVQPSSYDITLSNKIRVFKNIHKAFIDVREKNGEDLTELVECDEKSGIIVHPGEFILGASVEYFEFPNDLVGCLEGRSSLGRLGLIVHSTAGYFDPGFKGTATLEITNLSRIPLKIYPTMRVGQFVFYKMTSPAANPYGSKNLQSKYQGQVDPTASRLHKDFE
ncbi:dCTP deaminase [candidate division WWE3 bacterium CG10_big_fil_rev_8_21_14_0_10_32_10]|uniref:dCTP deaminase, dUMP-forming n=1 Tax=candidate division WWE3 bacterium CG10_big_fil_rev_8_21_14_0_10_32_10 TaxID=1975090 RepID=A0A2H0RBE4_UNCKA|nr:MAG: dCTP deaminase [candidate division WWE3 bacterium CG10_big_fil_rev_8_21_14_0_10_32_10]